MIAKYTSKDPEWRGPERRIRQRRQIADRRAMARFEPDKVDRRVKAGNRRDDLIGWNNKFACH